MSLEIVAWVIIPLTLFILAAAGTGLTLLVKGVTYMARSDENQKRTADSNDRIESQLTTYIDQNDKRLGLIELDIAVLKAAGQNGRAH